MLHFTSLNTMNAMRDKRLLNEAKIAKAFSQENKKYGLSLQPQTKNGKLDLYNWDASVNVCLEKDSPYYGQTYKLQIHVTDSYPTQPPQMKFITKIFHPNVNAATGEICMSLLKTESEVMDVLGNKEESWSIASNLNQLVLGIQSLIYNLSTYSPLNVDAANFIDDGDKLLYKSMVDYVYYSQQ